MKVLTKLGLAFLALAVLGLMAGCGEESDSDPPGVSMITPADNDTAVPLNASITVRFDEKIDPASIEGALEISPGISGVLVYDERTRTLTFRPSENFSPDTEYTIIVKGVRDISGNEMKAYTSKFTGIGKDGIFPCIIETVPVADEEDVFEDTNYVFIKFSEEIDRLKVASAFSVRGNMNGDVEIIGARWFDTTTFELKIRNSQIENDEKITVKVDRNCVEDFAGNKMAEDYSFSFTIEGINPVGRPWSYSSRTLSYSIWQGTSGEWFIRWAADWSQGAPPRYDDSPSQPDPPAPPPKPGAKPKPYYPEYHYFSGSIVTDGNIIETLDPYSFADSDRVQMEIEGNLVKVTGDEIVVERNEANMVTVATGEITVDGDIGDMVTVTDDAVTVNGDIVVVVEGKIILKGTVITLKSGEVTVRGDAGSNIVVEGEILSVEGNMIILDGEITSLDGSALVVDGDVMIIQGNTMWFAGSTGTDDSSDGFDFISDGTYLTFDIQIDNEYMEKNVFIGDKSKHPREIPFELRSRYPYDSH